MKNKYKNEKKKNESEKSHKSKDNNEEVWIVPKRKPSHSEIKKMFGMALRRLIVISMKNHIYEFNSEIKLQSDGGATGYDETGELADLYMLWWDRQFIEKIKDFQLIIDLFARFKDDCNMIGEGIPIERDYDPTLNKMVTKSASPIGEDISIEEHTAKVLNSIANSIDDMISFTHDVPSNYSDGFLPVLDVKVKLQDSGNC